MARGKSNYAAKKLTSKLLLTSLLIAVFMIGYFSFVFLFMMKSTLPMNVIASTMGAGYLIFIYLIYKFAKTLKVMGRVMGEHERINNKLKNSALNDPETGLYNKNGFVTLIKHHLMLAKREKSKVLLFYLRIFNFEEDKKLFGKDDQRAMLLDVVRVIKKAFRKSDIIGRINKDTIMIFLIGASEKEANKVSRKFHEKLKLHNARRHDQHKLKLRYCSVPFCPTFNERIDDMLAHADETLFSRNHNYEKVYA